MANVGDAGGSIRVEGLRETIKQLEALGADKAEIVNANFQAAETLRKAALPLVPVYNGTKAKNGTIYQYKNGGALRASLRSSKAKGYAQVLMGNARVVYANPIHWGWFEDKESFIQKNIKPNKFLYRALGTRLTTIIDQYNKDMQQLIDKYGLGDK
jgi:hypothetical protein